MRIRQEPHVEILARLSSSDERESWPSGLTLFKDGRQVGHHDDSCGDQRVEDGKKQGHVGGWMGERVVGGSFKQLHPAAGAFVVLGLDPDAGNHQLECQQGAGGDKTNDGEAGDEFVRTHILGFTLHGECRRL